MNQNPHGFIMDYIVGPLIIFWGAVVPVLPAVALIIPVVWYAIQIYESMTFKKWLTAWGRMAKNIGGLLAKILSIVKCSIKSTPEKL